MVYQTLLSHPSSCGKDQRCECSLFNFCDSFAVHPLLLILMHALHLFRSKIVRLYVRLCICVTYTRTSKMQIFVSLPCTSSRASADSFDPGFEVSPLTSCNTGSICTSLQTTFRSSASKSRNSLCRWMMKPPRLHIIAWSMLKDSPTCASQ